MPFLAIDFGGTRTRAAWFDDNMTLRQRDETLTLAHEPPVMVIERIVETAQRVIPSGKTPIAVGVAAPGPLDAGAGVILHAATLPGWQKVPLASYISEGLNGVPVYIHNDGNLAALAEVYFGAAENADPALYMTLSTGIGGGAVLRGALFTGWRGMAIEPGHMRFRLPDGTFRRLEELASGTALGQRSAERLAADPSLVSTLRDVDTIDGKAVGAAAIAGDAFALAMVRDAGTWLGLGIVNLLHLFNPEAVVLGGSVSLLGDLLLDPVREVVRGNLMHGRFYDPGLIRLAALGDDVCLYGAAHYARTCSRWQKPT
jgi:glucokinase